METKKEWTTPELIVLVRSNPEEAVLTACKGTSSGMSNNADSYCMWQDGNCGACEAMTGS
jgi:hypothetical protein